VAGRFEIFQRHPLSPAKIRQARSFLAKTVTPPSVFPGAVGFRLDWVSVGFDPAASFKMDWMMFHGAESSTSRDDAQGDSGSAILAHRQDDSARKSGLKVRKEKTGHL
jgi:hypothetical protein